MPAPSPDKYWPCDAPEIMRASTGRAVCWHRVQEGPRGGVMLELRLSEDASWHCDCRDKGQGQGCPWP